MWPVRPKILHRPEIKSDLYPLWPGIHDGNIDVAPSSHGIKLAASINGP